MTLREALQKHFPYITPETAHIRARARKLSRTYTERFLSYSSSQLPVEESLLARPIILTQVLKNHQDFSFYFLGDSSRRRYHAKDLPGLIESLLKDQATNPPYITLKSRGKVQKSRYGRQHHLQSGLEFAVRSGKAREVHYKVLTPEGKMIEVQGREGMQKESLQNLRWKFLGIN